MKRLLFRCGLAFLVTLGLVFVIYGGTSRQNEGTRKSALVVLADPADAYYPLAQEIAQAENATVSPSIADALDLDPIYLLWVVSPENLSDVFFSRFGAEVSRRNKPVSTGIITGGTLSKARALWQRKDVMDDKLVSIVPREETIEINQNGSISTSSISKESFANTVKDADYLIFQGHGAGTFWAIAEDTTLKAKDIPPLGPLFVDAMSCQTLKIWRDESIALAFIDQGAAGYAGFVHSPEGELLGAPHNFAFRYTYPDFPIGHALQVLNQGFSKGYHSWSFYFLLGDPRLHFQATPPYRLVDDRLQDTERILSYAGAPRGIIPIRIPDAAGYNYIEIENGSSLWRGDPLYNPVLQAIDIGGNKYVLIDHPGGNITLKLRTSPPIYWPAAAAGRAAMDYATVILHADGSIAMDLGMAIIFTFGFLFLLIKRRKSLTSRRWWVALIPAMALAGLRGGYALLNNERLVHVYTGYIRTIDTGFNINWFYILSTFILAFVGSVFWLNVKSRIGRLIVMIVIISPTWFALIFHFLVWTSINILAIQQYGTSLYGEGTSVMLGITCAIELFCLSCGLFCAGKIISLKKTKFA